MSVVGLQVGSIHMLQVEFLTCLVYAKASGKTSFVNVIGSGQVCALSMLTSGNVIPQSGSM